MVRPMCSGPANQSTMAMRYRANTVGATLPAIVSKTTRLIADRATVLESLCVKVASVITAITLERERESYACGGYDHLDVVARHISEYFVMGRCSWQVPPSNQYRAMPVAAPPPDGGVCKRRSS